jgi:hypothetical protein
MNENKEKFWLEDMTYLYRDGNYIKFIPTYKMTKSEQLNSITRFSIYLSILLVLFSSNAIWYNVPVIIFILAIILYYFNRFDAKGKEKELNKILKIRGDKREEEKKEYRREYLHDGDTNIKLPIDPVDFNMPEKKRNYEIESGYYDSNGKLTLGKKEKLDKYYEKQEPSLYTIDEIMSYEKNTCRRPTTNNPMMNPSIVDYGADLPDPPVACNADDSDIKDNIRVNFNHELFRDVDELWERANSQRQFYTLPNTAIPNNQTEFAKWLFGNTENCKTDNQACLRYEDLRTAGYHVV